MPNTDPNSTSSDSIMSLFADGAASPLWTQYTTTATMTDNSGEEGKNVVVSGRNEWLFRPIRNLIIGSTAEHTDVNIGDSVTFDVVVYDSRSKLTKKANDVVAKGISNYLAQKSVRFRHVDPNKDAYALLGDVGNASPVINNLVADDGSTYMEVISPLKLVARTEGHLGLIKLILKKAEDYAKSGDKKDLMGVSLGWVESDKEFIPHEISVTPYPKCKTCVFVPGSQQLVKATAESGNSCNNGCNSNTGEKSLTDKIVEELKEKLFDQRMLVKEKDTEIVSLKAELDNVKLEAKNTLSSAVAEAQSTSETVLAERTSEVSTLKEENKSLKADVESAKTLPLRREIAEDILGYKDDVAKVKVESLSNMSEKGLTQVRDDLKESAKLASEKAEKKFKLDEPTPFLSGAEEFTPNVAEGLDMNMSDEDFAKKILGKEIFDRIGTTNRG